MRSNDVGFSFTIQERLSDLIGPVTWGTYGIVFGVLQPLLDVNLLRIEQAKSGLFPVSSPLGERTCFLSRSFHAPRTASGLHMG